MNNHKHTPGPWSISSMKSELTLYDWILRHERGPLALISSPWIDDWEANARLIAAAPELLEALEAMLAADLYADGEGVWAFAIADTIEGAEAVSKARAAIAKATGGGQ